MWRTEFKYHFSSIRSFEIRIILAINRMHSLRRKMYNKGDRTAIKTYQWQVDFFDDLMSIKLSNDCDSLFYYVLKTFDVKDFDCSPHFLSRWTSKSQSQNYLLMLTVLSLYKREVKHCFFWELFYQIIEN